MYSIEKATICPWNLWPPRLRYDENGWPQWRSLPGVDSRWVGRVPGWKKAWKNISCGEKSFQCVSSIMVWMFKFGHVRNWDWTSSTSMFYRVFLLELLMDDDGCLRLQLHLLSANHTVSIMVPCRLLWHCWPHIHQLYQFAMVGATRGSAASPTYFFTCAL